MKKLLLILVAACLLPFTKAFATEAEDANEAARLMTKAEKLYKKHMYLEAMDSATLAYRTFPKSVAARTFIYKHWDQTIRYATALLESHSEVEKLADSRVRFQTYRLLMSINDNLQASPLPLRGNYDKWVWMPEMQYWDGYYFEEKKRLKRLEAEFEAEQQALEAEVEEPLNNNQ